MALLHPLQRLIGIDLGTSRTRIWLVGKGLVIDQPTAIAVDRQSGKVLAVGDAAAEMRGRVHTSVIVHQPVQQAKLYDAHTARALLQYWLQKILGLGYVMSPTIMISVPASSTQAARAALTQLCYDLGAREVYTIAQPLAAAIGSGVPIADASGTLLFQLGAGVAEAALISLGSLIAQTSSRQGGYYLDEQIQLRLQQEQSLLISQEQISELKQLLLRFGNAPEVNRLVVGQDSLSHAPKELEISSHTLRPLTTEVAQHLSQLVKTVLTTVPPELTTDVLDKGMLLAGGLAQLSGLEQYLTQELGIPVALVEEPDLAVIRGIGTALEHLDEFRQSFGQIQR